MRWFRRNSEQDLRDEFADHLARQTEAFLADGLEAAAAERAARRRLADIEARMEDCRSVRCSAALAALLQDLRHAVRGWRRRPRLAAVLIGMLALGLGATTTVFAVVYAVLWRPMPYPHPDRLAMIEVQQGNLRYGIAPGVYPRILGAPGFSSIGMIEGGTEHDSFFVARLSPSLLPTLGIEPALGRNFLPEEAVAGRDGEVLLSDAVWRTRFGADPRALGKPLEIGDRLYTIVGVMAPHADDSSGVGLGTYGKAHAVWIPAVVPGNASGVPWGSGQVYARLAPRVTWQEAAAALAAFSRNLNLGSRNRPAALSLLNLASSQRASPYRRELLPLLTAVGLLLLISCTNVAGLLLARSVGRRQEMAMRQALGAGTWRIVRLLLCEGAVLAAAGGGLGLLLAALGGSWVRSSPLTISRIDQTRLSPAVVVVALAASAGCAMLVSAAPAVRLSQRQLWARGTLGAGSGGRLRTRSALLVAEVALTFMLLIGAALAGTGLARVYRMNPGFDVGHLAEITLRYGRATTPAERQLLAQRAVLVVRALPGVSAVSLAAGAPFDEDYIRFFSLQSGGGMSEAWMQAVAPEYFSTVGQRVLGGRAFTAADTASAPGVVVVNQAWARQYSPHHSPLGMQLYWQGQAGGSARVVGVARDAREESPDLPPEPGMYLPYTQFNKPPLALVLRAAHPEAVADEARRALVAALPEAPVDTALPVAALRSQDLATPRFEVEMMIAFAGLALLFALAGIWALVAFTVEARRREFGIRVALGAAPAQLMRMALRQVAALTAVGAAAGLVGAWLLSRFLTAYLFQLSPTDPATYAAATLAFAAVALIAAAIPARRVLDADAAVALRSE